MKEIKGIGIKFDIEQMIKITILFHLMDHFYLIT